MAKLKSIKIKNGAIKIIKDRFQGVSERSIYYYLAGPRDLELRNEEYRTKCLAVRQFARQYERR